MTDALEKILDRVRRWPKERQEDAAAILEQMDIAGAAPYVLSGDERADLTEALAEVERGEVAGEKDVADFFQRVRG
jgi:hypothetical protein